MSALVFEGSRATAISTANATEASRFRLGHRPALNGLRGISIILVLILHLPLPFQILPGGFLGVDLFFVISGFLITSLLVEEYGSTGSISLRRFYIRRALRLAPALIAALAFACFLALLAGSFSSIGLSPARLTSTIFYFTNWIRAFEGKETAPWLLAHFWSLSIEEQFYLLWPAVLLTLLKKDRRVVVSVVIGAIVASCLAKVALYSSGATLVRMYYGSDTRADALLIGCLLSLALHWNFLPRFIKRHQVGLSRVAWVLLAVFALCVGWRDAAILYLGGFTLVSLAGAMVITRSLFAPAPILTHPVLVWIGKRSYGLYIWHWPVYMLTGGLPARVAVPVSLIATVCVAALSFRYIENPFLELKHRYSSSSSRQAKGVLAV